MARGEPPLTGHDHGWRRPAAEIRRVLSERKLLILVVTVAFAAVALFLDSIAQRRYLVTTTIRLQSVAEEASLFGARVPRPTVGEGEAVRLARDPKLVQRALSKAGPQLIRRLSRDTAIVPVASGLRMVLLGRTETPVPAARLVDIYAREIAEAIRKEEVRRLDRLIERLTRARRPNRRGDPVRTIENYRVDQRLQRLRLIRRVANPAVISGPAEIPREREGDGAGHVAAVTLFGFCLSIVLAFLVDLVTRRPRDVDRLTSLAGMPVAGAIPRLRDGSSGSVAYDLLRAAVAVPSGGQMIVVTSGAPGEGKSTVALGLAEAFARAGRRTCLVEADLRRPALAERLGIPNVGLGELVRGTIELDDLGTDVDTRDAAARLTVVVAGRPLRRPAEGLRTVADDLLGRLASRFDALIVDTPPVLAVADAWPLLDRAAAVLFCVRVGVTATDDLEASSAIVARLAGDRARLVVNAARVETAGAVPMPLPLIARRRQTVADREPTRSVVH